ncbi:MAG: hypothetical protein R3E95_05075 [Thiolinea sp.]
MLTIFATVLPVFLLIGTGYLAVRSGYLLDHQRRAECLCRQAGRTDAAVQRHDQARLQ